MFHSLDERLHDSPRLDHVPLSSLPAFIGRCTRN
jgi:hypothetical protein